MNDVRLTLEGVSGEPLTIPPNEIPIGTTSLTIDIRNDVRPVTIISLPQSLKQLTIGTKLSESLSEIQLPQFLENYSGPVFHDTRLPITLRSLTYVQNFASIDIQKVAIPSGVSTVGIVTTSETASVDNVNLPNNTTSLSIEGPFNTSIDKMNTKNVINLSMPSTFHQPFGINDVTSVPGNLANSVPVISGREGMDQLMKYLPSLNHLHVILGDEINDMWDVWTKVLFEGMVNVRSLTIDGSKSKNVLKYMYRVIDRSVELGRPIARKIHITGLYYNMAHEVSYYKIGQSLINLHDIEITVTHANSVSNIAPSIARIMGMYTNRYDRELGHVYYKVFGAVSTQVYILNDTSIVIDKGEGPKHKRPNIPESSFSPMEIDEIEEIIVKPIILYSWTQCGYCKQQDEIVVRFKGHSEENSRLFDRLVDIQKVEDPSSIQDDRVKSFPTWVTGESISPGVKDSTMIKNLLDSNNI